MRAAITTILGFILIGLLVLTFWPTGAATPFDPSPPGQYPLGASRPEWPATERVKAYTPTAAMGTNDVKFNSNGSAKVRCATATTCSPTTM